MKFFLRNSLLCALSSHGQAVIFMIMALTVLVFMLLWKVDLASIIRAKDRAQNAGDAAALAGARWQAASLNLIGEMNLLHAMAVLEDDEEACGMLVEMQARMCYAGPMAGLLAMQQAAKHNRIPVNDEFTEFMRDHLETVQFSYPVRYPEPWPDAWREYAEMLDAITRDGIAAGPDNFRLHGEFDEAHILADKAFYRAVAASNWCWFFLNYGNPLEWYDNYRSWPDLPPMTPSPPEDCEFLGLRVQRFHLTLPMILPQSRPVRAFLEQADALHYTRFPGESAPVMTQLTERAHTWMRYQPGAWGRWDVMWEDGFPIAGEVKPEFDYTGADNVARVLSTSTRLSAPNNTGRRRGRNSGPPVDEITWTAAAKPFGHLTEGSRPVLPTAFNLVLPAFRAVRLIPVDAASEGSPGGFDLGFHRHVREHLPEYMRTGRTHPACRWCRSLERFDDSEFRRRGRDWLAENSGLCTLPSPGGGYRGGGTQRGH